VTQIRLTLIQPTYRISLEQRELRFSFPRSIPPTELPTDGSVGDVLTWNGSVWEAGAPGSAANLEVWPAGENLSAGRVVVIDAGEAFYFQNTDATHKGRAYGVTKTSAASGSNVTIQVQGVIQDAAFSFTADKSVWVGADGEIFDTIPATGSVIQKAGVASENRKMLIDFSIQILKT